MSNSKNLLFTSIIYRKLLNLQMQTKQERKARRVRSLVTFSTMIRSPIRRVGYMEEEGMNRISESINHKRNTTKSLMKPSRPGHRRNPQLWHGIHRREGKSIRSDNKEGLERKLMASTQSEHKNRKQNGKLNMIKKCDRGFQFRGKDDYSASPKPTSV